MNLGYRAGNRLYESSELQVLEHALESGDYQEALDAANDVQQVFLKDEEASSGKKFTENVFAPLIQAYHENVEYEDVPGSVATRESYEGPELYLKVPDGVRQEFHELSAEPHQNHVLPDSRSITELREAVEDVEEGIDAVVGITTGGVAPAYAVADVIDAEVVLEGYSRVRQGDDRVETVEGFSDVDYSGSRVLVVDDTVETGETLRKVGEKVLGDGAEEVYAAVAERTVQPETEEGKNYGGWKLFDGGEIVDIMGGCFN